ncbi:unnamed protein product [Gadus morhua 'NCC']
MSRDIRGKSWALTYLVARLDVTGVVVPGSLVLLIVNRLSRRRVLMATQTQHRRGEHLDPCAREGGGGVRRHITRTPIPLSWNRKGDEE